MQVLHYNTRVLEENHYYPFGLTLSTAAMGITQQPLRYQSIELEENFGLETYETFYRGLDPQLGRFTQIDPKADQFVFQSPYVSMDNNPIRKIDPLGLSASSPDDYVFNEKGNYVRTDKTNQPDRLVTENSQTKQKTNYVFNDPKVDALAIRNGVSSNGAVGITRVEFASDALVEKQIERSGVRDKQAQKYPLTYAKQQGAFKMDYGVKGVLAGDLKSNTFYIRGNIAYNVGDFGNYL